MRKKSPKKLAYGKGPCPKCGAQMRIPYTDEVAESSCAKCGSTVVSKVIAIMDVDKGRLEHVHNRINHAVRVLSNDYDAQMLPKGVVPEKKEG